METLIIQSEDKKEIVKQVNKFRLSNKNKWYQVNITHNGKTYKGKLYNTWAQIFRKYEGENLIHNNPGPMDQTVTQFKNFIESNL